MAIHKIRYFDDPILRVPCKPIDSIDTGLVQIIDDMIETMYSMPAYGLAANQIGYSLNLFVLDTAWNYETGENKQTMVFINPQILQVADEVDFEEGCLSIPGGIARTKRYNTLELRYLDEKFNEHIKVFQDLTAIAIQHEVEHLRGELFIDGFGPVKKQLVLDRSRKRIKQIRRGR